ncbi:chloride channel protein [Streptococcus ruminantium]|uniref:chloride channel protein n=1 Tax=Streptococcus ruminantium TaxID=1917441 RepID=UPI0012DC28B0|nr:chloride channel protein [Streptococcus ruminantium]
MSNRGRFQVQLFILSLTSGIIAGLVTTLFGNILLGIGELRSKFFLCLIPFLALAGLALVFAYQNWGKSVRSGMDLVFKAGQGQDTHISPVLIPLIMLTTWISHLFGASVGREGVAVQLGVALSHWLGTNWFKSISKDLIVKIGMAAGFAGLFQTPLAASFFAIEVLVVGSFSWTSLPYCLLAAFTASTTSHLLGLEKFSHIITIPDFQIADGFKFLLLSLCFGIIGNLFAWILEQAKTRINIWLSDPYKRVFYMGLLLTALLFIFHQGRYSGLGTNLIEFSLEGEQIFTYDWFLKLILTCLCLVAGFQGGEVTPLFAIGASSGAVLAGILGLPIELVAALGYCTVFSSATNTLLAPILIGYEVFGISLVPYAVPVLYLAYFINRKESIYRQQLR